MKPINKTFKKIFLATIIQIALWSQDLMAMAQRPTDPNAPPPPGWVSWMPMIVMIAVFYFLLIRPQMRQKKERQTMLNAIKKDEKVITQGGLIVTVVSVGPTILDVKLNDSTKVRILRSAVTDIYTDQTQQKEKEPALISK